MSFTVGGLFLREAGLLSHANMIRPMTLSRRLARAIAQRSVGDLSVFPASAADLKEWMQ